MLRYLRYPLRCKQRYIVCKQRDIFFLLEDYLQGLLLNNLLRVMKDTLTVRHYKR